MIFILNKSDLIPALSNLLDTDISSYLTIDINQKNYHSPQALSDKQFYLIRKVLLSPPGHLLTSEEIEPFTLKIFNIKMLKLDQNGVVTNELYEELEYFWELNSNSHILNSQTLNSHINFDTDRELTIGVFIWKILTLENLDNIEYKNYLFYANQKGYLEIIDRTDNRSLIYICNIFKLEILISHLKLEDYEKLETLIINKISNKYLNQHQKLNAKTPSSSLPNTINSFCSE